MPRAVVWQQGSLQDLSLVLPVEAQLRPLIPSVAAAEAALWAAMADSGTQRHISRPDVGFLRSAAAEKEAAAANEPSCGDAVAAIRLLRGLGFKAYAQDAPEALSVWSGTWRSDVEI